MILVVALIGGFLLALGGLIGLIVCGAGVNARRRGSL